MASMGRAIHHVAHAIDDQGICFSHQFRILRSARPVAAAILLENSPQLKACTSFHELHGFLESLLYPVYGLGEMYIYDAALRMGAFLNLSPEFIYLHRGTRDGARALRLNVRGRPYLEIRELPKELHCLSADDLESFLCAFKDRF